MADFTHKILQGAGAGKYLPFALQKVAILHARARAMRVNALVQRWTVEAGMVEIAVRVSGDQRFIHIRRKQCPPFLSGLCDLVLHSVSGEATPVYEVPDPNDPTQTINVFRRFFPSPAQVEPARAWRDEPKLAVNVEEGADAAKQMIKLRGSMFSGEMRKVVQVLQGAGVFIPYSPTYAKTHGVFKSASGQRWVIEISSQGVVAWVMGMCRNPIRSIEGEVLLDYTPIATSKPQDIEAAKAAGAYIELAPASAVLDAYTRAAFFDHCGWAFDATGHAAANVCQRSEAPDDTVRAYMYSIAIQETDDRPVSASMALLESGWLLGPITNHMKYPASNYNQLFSFALDYRAPADRDCETPVYCYYDGDALVVARYVHYPSSGYVQSTTAATDLCESVGTVGTFEDATHTGSPVQGFSIGSYAAPTAGLSSSVSSRLEIGQKQYVGAVIDVVAPYSWRRAYVSAWAHSSNVIETTGYRSVLIVPLFDREALYYALETARTSSIPTYQTIQRVCTDSNILSAISVTECSFPDQDEVVLLGGEIETPTSSFCPDGSERLGCSGDGFACNATVSFQGYPDVDAGTPVTTGLIDEGCIEPSNPPTHASSKACLSGLFGNSATYQFEYHASGGVSRSLGQPIFPDRLFGPIEDGEFQLMMSVRDAFAASRYAISPDVAGDENWIFASLNAYPTDEVAVTIGFLGVP